jgi:hypothetical protein
MERIDVYRGGQSTDDDGNTVQGAMELWKSFDGLVAPVSVPQTPATDSLGVEYDHTIYIRSNDVTGILDTDVIGVRGRRVPVDGVVGVWRDRAGTHIGDVINVRLKEG